MSFFFPIGEPEEAPAAGTFAGATSLAAQLTVTMRLAAHVCAGATALQATLGAQATFAGATQLVASLRIGGEVNVFLSAEVLGSTVLAPPNLSIALGGFSAIFAGATEMTAAPTLTSADEYGFTFYIDILDAALVSSNVRRYTARLLADAVEVPITGFQLREPSDRLGAALQVTLARPDTSQISLASSVQFDIGVWNGSGWTWVNFLTSGKLAGRGHSISFAQGRPADAVQVSFVDVFGDAWARAPRQPVTLYDPQKVDAPGETQNLLYTEAGAAIKPLAVPMPGMTLRDVLEYAYVTGCGFSSVVTNIPNFPVAEASFTLEGGYDSGARSLVAPFDPLFFVADGGVLWIYDLDAPMPAGLSPVELPLSSVVEVSDTLPAREPSNALIVSYQAPEGDYYTERIEQETDESGSFGSPGYTKTETERRVREYRSAAEPTRILREVVTEAKTSVYNAQLELIHRETQQDSYDSLQRKTGHTRAVESLVPDLASGDLVLMQVMDERNSTGYRPHPTRPGESLQDASTTVTSGLVLVDKENEYRDKPFRLPYTDAHRNGFIDLDADQETEYVPIKTVRESLRARGDGQVDVSVIVIDHLTGTTERSQSSPRTGSVSIDTRGTRVRRTLLTLPGTDSDGRRVPTLNASALPGEVALPLGRRQLEKQNAPPKEATFGLPGVSFSIRKGTQVKPHARSGYLGTYVVTERTVRGARLGTADARIEMGLEARELKT